MLCEYGYQCEAIGSFFATQSHGTEDMIRRSCSEDRKTKDMQCAAGQENEASTGSDEEKSNHGE